MGGREGRRLPPRRRPPLPFKRKGGEQASELVDLGPRLSPAQVGSARPPGRPPHHTRPSRAPRPRARGRCGRGWMKGAREGEGTGTHADSLLREARRTRMDGLPLLLGGGLGEGGAIGEGQRTSLPLGVARRGGRPRWSRGRDPPSSGSREGGCSSPAKCSTLGRGGRPAPAPAGRLAGSRPRWSRRRRISPPASASAAAPPAGWRHARRERSAAPAPVG